ncbi:MAG: putative xylanase/chitin deacetylase, partial [Planctomycetota bacterium]
MTAGQVITVANITSGNLKFRPDANENGSPYTTFTFSVGEASAFAASPSTMTVNVTPVNDAPTGGNQTVTTAEDTDFTFTTSDFPFSDVDGGSLARVRIDTLPTDGTVLLSGVAVTAGQIITAANITSGNLK